MAFEAWAQLIFAVCGLALGGLGLHDLLHPASGEVRRRARRDFGSRLNPAWTISELQLRDYSGDEAELRSRAWTRALLTVRGGEAARPQPGEGRAKVESAWAASIESRSQVQQRWRGVLWGLGLYVLTYLCLTPLGFAAEAWAAISLDAEAPIVSKAVTLLLLAAGPFGAIVLPAANRLMDRKAADHVLTHLTDAAKVIASDRDGSRYPFLPPDAGTAG